jgi:integrase
MKAERLDERIATLICLEMGLRISEVCGLRHEDRDGAGVWIKRTVTRAEGVINVRNKTKTARSNRWVPIPPSLVNEIGKDKTGYVVTGSKIPGYPDNISRAINRVIERAGVKGIPHLGPHTLRRTYGMKMLEAGVDVVTASELMGHDPRMLLDEYTRSREDLKIEAVKRAFGG